MKRARLLTTAEIPESPRLGILVSYSDVFGTSPPSDSLTRIAKEYRQSELLVVLGRLALLVRSWQNIYNSETQRQLVEMLFPVSAVKVRAAADRCTASGFVPLVFTRLGLLFFSRHIVEHSTEDGRPISSSGDWESLGRALLICNDFYLGYQPNDDDDLLQRAAGFLPAHEHLPGDGYLDEMARTMLMVETILKRPEVVSHADYLDVHSDFIRRYGSSLQSFFNVIFGLVAHSVELSENLDLALKGDVVIRPTWFDKTKLEPQAVLYVLGQLGIGIADLQSAFKDMKSGTDFSPIQRKPLLKLADGHLCLDLTYLFEKCGRAFIWVLRDIYDKAQGERLLRFWGRVFESYFEWIWGELYRGRGVSFFSPKYSDGQDREISDSALLEEDALVLFECKASVVTTAAKQSFSGSSLGSELYKKFVEDRAEKVRPKGVGQLAGAVENISGPDRQHLPFSLRSVERIYTVLVTLDPVIEAPFIREYLDGCFRRRIENVKPKEIITPLFVIHIADMERLLRYTNTFAFTELLRIFTRRHHQAKHFPGPIADFMEPLLRQSGIEQGHDPVGKRIAAVMDACRAMFEE